MTTVNDRNEKLTKASASVCLLETYGPGIEASLRRYERGSCDCSADEETRRPP